MRDHQGLVEFSKLSLSCVDGGYKYEKPTYSSCVSNTVQRYEAVLGVIDWWRESSRDHIGRCRVAPYIPRPFKRRTQLRPHCPL